jgi:predicted ester cyclase
MAAPAGWVTDKLETDMRLDRRSLLALTAALPVVSASAACPQAQTFPPPVPDVPASHVQQTPVAEKNADIIRRQMDLLNQGKVAEAVENFASDTRNHGVAVGRAGLTRVLGDIHATFPDWKEEIFDLMAFDDEVVVRVLGTGTHLGTGRIPVNGGLLMGVPPTGKRFKVQSIHWYVLKEGLIVEHRASRDDIGMMQQLGLLPMVARYDLPKVS